MQEFKVGDKVLVPMKIVDITESGVYYLKRESVYYHVAKEIMQKFEKENECTGKTYEDGMAEAWEVARKLCAPEDDGGILWDDIHEMFGVNKFYDAFKNFTASEATAKIKAWEEGKKFHVGDVVRHHGKECVVTKIFDSDPEKCYLLWEDGGTGTGAFSKFEKTGRTIDIAGLLAEIGGAE